ncbi:MAG: sigma-70 family RNA polymerase sigma factor [Bacteroidetes bacterium]|nr:sigma-70 family RNA polymerase sigma factor [Bacteroidota bacterium]
MSEEEMIKGCLKNDPLAQRTLYNRLGPKMMGVSLRYMMNTEEAQDVLQDGFVKVFDKLGGYSGSGSFEGWVRRIFVNTALDAIRRNKNFKHQTQIDDVAFSLKSDDFIFETLVAEDLMKMLQKLPLGYKTVFNLYAIEGYSHKEIAEKMNITVSTSKSQFSRAKAVLREKITELEKE